MATIPREDPLSPFREREKKNEHGAGEGKTSATFWPPTLWAPTLLTPTLQAPPVDFNTVQVEYTVQLHGFAIEDCRKSHFNSIQDADLCSTVSHLKTVARLISIRFQMRFCEVFGAAPRFCI